jgi:BTB/POZ domain-containing protein KCTD9
MIQRSRRSYERVAVHRRNWEETCALLRERGLLSDDLGFLGPLNPRLPDRMPSPDDDDSIGIAIYKGGFAPGYDLSNLTLPRTFVSRSRIENVSFSNTDLSESWLCWNNFEHVDFSNADLSRSDLRCSEFERVSFANANLSRADLRGSYFEGCDFADAKVEGALLMPGQPEALGLTVEQLRQVVVTDDSGPDPGGG